MTSGEREVRQRFCSRLPGSRFQNALCLVGITGEDFGLGTLVLGTNHLAVRAEAATVYH